MKGFFIYLSDDLSNQNKAYGLGYNSYNPFLNAPSISSEGLPSFML
jgi:hypothetical protein